MKLLSVLLPHYGFVLKSFSTGIRVEIYRIKHEIIYTNIPSVLKIGANASLCFVLDRKQKLKCFVNANP